MGRVREERVGDGNGDGGRGFAGRRARKDVLNAFYILDPKMSLISPPPPTFRHPSLAMLSSFPRWLRESPFRFLAFKIPKLLLSRRDQTGMKRKQNPASF